MDCICVHGEEGSSRLFELITEVGCLLSRVGIEMKV